MHLEVVANSELQNYICFEKSIEREGRPPKIRYIQTPKQQLRQLQRRLANLLNRIEPPSYIHSGFRGRSYSTNAKSHGMGTRLAKIDIRSFFPSSSAVYVDKCFRNEFECSLDVAAVLTKLTTLSGHLPTGAGTSTILSYYAYKPMFGRIYSMAKSCGLTMSCCVDDMTFSGAAASAGFLNKVAVVVKSFGLKVHKRKCFEPHECKIVTGVAVTPQGYRLPNVRRKKLHEAYSDFENEVNLERKEKLGERLLGRATEAAQIEEQFKKLVPLASEKLRNTRTTIIQENIARASRLHA